MLCGNSFQRFKGEPANSLQFIIDQETCIDGNLQPAAFSAKNAKGIQNLQSKSQRSPMMKTNFWKCCRLP